MRTVKWAVLICTVVIAVGALLPAISTSARAQTPNQAETPKPTAPEYVGLTKCAACHFAQYKVWKSSAHGKAFDILPTKYKKDAECLKCHTTGFGHASGFKDSTNAQLAGISCEACHGPGGEHAKHALRFVDEGITEAGLNRLRASIQRLALDQCIKCHVSKAHKVHPPFDRDEPITNKRAQLGAPRSPSFFSFKAHDQQLNP